MAMQIYIWKIKLHVTALADLGGAWGTHAPPLGVQILSISCSFRENWRVHAPPGGFTPPPRENPGSATGSLIPISTSVKKFRNTKMRRLPNFENSILLSIRNPSTTTRKSEDNFYWISLLSKQETLIAQFHPVKDKPVISEHPILCIHVIISIKMSKQPETLKSLK